VRATPSAAQVRAIHLRRRVLLVYGVVALALIPWISYLSSSLPSKHQTAHWDILWSGFDVGLLAAAVATAVAVVRRSRALPLVASITGTLLRCDAWFDLLTSQPGSERAWAIAEAVAGEVPLALFSFWVAWDAHALAEAT
jgi:hypothetical protein